MNQRLAFLAQASRLLSESLDRETVLNRLPVCVLSSLADVCLIDLREGDRVVRVLAAARHARHKDRLQQFRLTHAERAMPYGCAPTIHTGKTVLLSLADWAHGDPAPSLTEHMEMLQELGAQSSVSVPMRSAQGIIGVLTCILTTPRRQFIASDLVLVEELSHRIAFALENARLYRTAQDELSRREALERQLMDANQRIHSILESITDGFLAVDAKGRLQYLNQRAEGLAEKPRKELIGKPLLREMPKLRGAINWRPLSKALTRRQPVHYEALHAPLQRWFSIHGYPSSDGLSVYFEDITERKRVEERLQGSLREKETLLKEVHHRVKNNLQVISSLLSLQSHQVSDPRVTRQFEESQHRIQSMALVHEKLYASSTLSKIDMASYIRTLAAQLLDGYVQDDRVRIQVNTDVSLRVDEAIPCGLLLNELISNALKHAFPHHRAGVIRITLSLEDQEYRLCIADDGVGLPAAVDIGHTPSLGLGLADALITQLRGTVQVDRHGGTGFAIRFPAQPPQLDRFSSEALLG